MIIQVPDIKGPALGWAVAVALGWKPSLYGTESIRAELPTGGVCAPFMPWFRWEHGGPIIEREVISVMPRAGRRPLGVEWAAERSGRPVSEQFLQHGQTPLVAAMRCYVASRLGGAVEVPDELIEVKA